MKACGASGQSRKSGRERERHDFRHARAARNRKPVPGGEELSAVERSAFCLSLSRSGAATGDES